MTAIALEGYLKTKKTVSTKFLNFRTTCWRRETVHLVARSHWYELSLPSFFILHIRSVPTHSTPLSSPLTPSSCIFFESPLLSVIEIERKFRHPKLRGGVGGQKFHQVSFNFDDRYYARLRIFTGSPLYYVILWRILWRLLRLGCCGQVVTQHGADFRMHCSSAFFLFS